MSKDKNHSLDKNRILQLQTLNSDLKANSAQLAF